MASWALAGGLALAFLGERLPMLRRDVFSALPLIGGHWAAYRVVEQGEDGEDGD